jgi:2-hydroxychromene-2-carboxylate isomerase
MPQPTAPRYHANEVTDVKRLIFYYDIVCPYAYLGSSKVEALAERAGVALTWTPILLGGVFRAIGAPQIPAQSMPLAKAALNLLDMKRWASLYQVPLALPPGHPRRSVEAMRLCHTVDGADRVRLTHALYRAYFVDNQDPSDRAVLAGVCRALGLDESLATTRIDAPEIKDALRRATDEAIADGVFGVPGFVVVSGERRKLYWGQDRMHLVERALAS